MNLKPLNNSVIVEQINPKVQENALFCSAQSNAEVLTARVISTTNKSLENGDKVVFFKFCACPYQNATKTFYIVNFDDILAKIEGEEIDEF